MNESGIMRPSMNSLAWINRECELYGRSGQDNLTDAALTEPFEIENAHSTPLTCLYLVVF